MLATAKTKKVITYSQIQSLGKAAEAVLVCSLEAARVQGEATLEVYMQYLRRSTVSGEGRHDELDDHGSIC